MKVCLVNNLYGVRAKGGAEKVVAVEAEELVAAGHDVTVISVGRSDATDGGVCSPGAACVTGHFGSVREILVEPRNLYLYGDGRRHCAVAKFFWHLIDVFSGNGPKQVMDAVRKVNPNVVHTHNLMGVGFRLPSFLRRGGFRHVHTVHDVQLINPSGKISVWGVGPLMRVLEGCHGWLLARVFGAPDVVIFPSDFMRFFHAKRGFFRGSRHEVIHNPSAEPDSAQRAASGKETRFLFVGQLEEHKGVGLLLDAWRAAGLSQAVLEIAGRGDMEDAVVKASKDDPTVVYRGRLDGAALIEAYRQASYCVVPSVVIENSPTVIAEAFAAGTPVVAFGVGGIPEMVRDGETGILVEVEKGQLAKSPRSDAVASLVSALRQAGSERSDVWSLMSENCRRIASANVAHRHVERLLEAYEK